MCVVVGLLLHNHVPKDCFQPLLRGYNYQVKHLGDFTLVLLDTLNGYCLCDQEERILSDIKNVVNSFSPKTPFSYFPTDWGDDKTLLKAPVQRCSTIDEAFEKYPPAMSTGSFRVEILN